MTDLEIMKACAEAMGIEYHVGGELDLEVWANATHGHFPYFYDPLNKDAQAMALVRKLEISLDNPHRTDSDEWRARGFGAEATNADLNRAICECVANMQAAK